MKRYDVIDLITEAPTAHGVHVQREKTYRQVMCEVRSVSRNEYYTALNSGFTPNYVFVLTLAEDYQDERYLRFHGKTYKVVRTYMTEDDGIEITAERSDENGTD